MDAAQEARRARMGQQGPEYHMQQAQEAVFLAMNGRTIEPYKLIANAVSDAVKALQMGLPADDLDCMPDVKRLPSDERYAEAFRIVATAVEAEAMRRQVAEKEPVTA